MEYISLHHSFIHYIIINISRSCLIFGFPASSTIRLFNCTHCVHAYFQCWQGHNGPVMGQSHCGENASSWVRSFSQQFIRIYRTQKSFEIMRKMLSFPLNMKYKSISFALCLGVSEWVCAGTNCFLMIIFRMEVCTVYTVHYTLYTHYTTTICIIIMFFSGKNWHCILHATAAASGGRFCCYQCLGTKPWTMWQTYKGQVPQQTVHLHAIAKIWIGLMIIENAALQRTTNRLQLTRFYWSPFNVPWLLSKPSALCWHWII